jgi:hypothetical protein
MKKKLRLTVIFVCVALLAIAATLVLTYLNQKDCLFCQNSTMPNSSTTVRPVNGSYVQSSSANITQSTANAVPMRPVNDMNSTYAKSTLNNTRMPANGMRFPANGIKGAHIPANGMRFPSNGMAGGPEGAPPRGMNNTMPSMPNGGNAPT